MESFTSLRSRTICLPLKDVDTDMIIPAQYLTSTERTGFGDHLFERLRIGNEQFIFNHKQAPGCKILLAGANFGCGSSREHAVWALMDFGIRAIIAPSFSDIFTNNAFKNGLLLIPVNLDTFKSLNDQLCGFDSELSINLGEQKMVSSVGQAYAFTIDAFNKERLLNGMDDLDYLIAHQDTIDRFKAKQKVFLHH